MSQYKSKPTILNMAPAEVASKFDDLTALSRHIDQLPSEELASIGELGFERDSIVVRNPQIGEMKFTITERSPQRIVFNANGMLPLGLIIDLVGRENNTMTEVTTTVDVEIPVMLRPFIGGKIQQVADAFGDMMSKIAGNNGF